MSKVIKINLFLGCLLLLFRYTGKRKMGIAISTIICLIVFALAHIGAYGSILQILLIQGIGSIFNFFCYLKSKNIVVSYAMHVLTDFIPFALAATGVLASLGGISPTLLF